MMVETKIQKSKLKILNFYLSFCVLHFALYVFLSGCAEMTPPHPLEILTHPLGKGFLKAGMDKKEILSAWGEPDEMIEGKTDRFGMSTENWVYKARIEDVPIGVGYLTKTYYLYFEGDTLVRFREAE